MPNSQKLFQELYQADTEDELESVLGRHTLFQGQSNWQPLGGSDNNYSIVGNQQSDPIGAVVEKLTNSVDAILLRRCIEAGVDPVGTDAPRSMADAVTRFYPADPWQDAKKYGLDIQLFGVGKRITPSLVIYDAGEGQHPDKFHSTFLSLQRGNKKKIPFVQGLYNMGGAGALVFCGKGHYQLIGSRRFDDPSGSFGFTLIRRHQMSQSEEQSLRATWYEYFSPNNEILRFNGAVDMQPVENFTVGTVVKLYSYHLPSGARSNLADAFAREVGSRLVQPALPMYVREPKGRYQKSKLDKTLVSGLARKLDRKLDEFQSHGEFTIRCSFGIVAARYWLFKARIGERTTSKTIEYIKKSFLGHKNRVLFSVNGQVHGALRGGDFVSRSLGFPLIRDHLIVIADCTGIHSSARSDLFMASRDRCRDSTVFSELRGHLRDYLKEKLRPLYDERKSHSAVDTSEIDDGIQSMYKHIVRDESIEALLQGNLDAQGRFPKRKDNNAGPRGKSRNKKERGQNPKASTLDPQLIPSVLRHDHDAARGSSLRALRVHEGGAKRVEFATDAEPQFFHRVEKQGAVRMSILSLKPGKSGGRRTKADRKKLDDAEFDDLFEANVSDPTNGHLSVHFNAKATLQPGDSVKVRVKLSVPNESSVEDWVWLRIVKPPARKSTKKEDTPDAGLPRCFLVKRDAGDQSDVQSWSDLKFPIDESVVVFPLVSDGMVEAIFVNLDSRVFVDYLATKKQVGLEARGALERRFAFRVFFHTLMMQSLILAKKYSIQRENESEEPGEVESYEFVSEMLSDQYVSMILRLDDAGEGAD